MKNAMYIALTWAAITGFTFQLTEYSSTWTEYNLPGIGTIEIPSTLEVQHSGITSFTEYLQDRMKINTEWVKHFVAQQKGLNEGLGVQKSTTYARVMVMSIPTTKGEETKLYEDPGYTYSELSQAENETKYIVEQMGGMKLLTFYHAKQVKINGYYALTVSYKRQLANNPPVIVTSYTFTNYDYQIQLMLSYREQDAYLYKDDFTTILNNFKITQIR